MYIHNFLHDKQPEISYLWDSYLTTSLLYLLQSVYLKHFIYRRSIWSLNHINYSSQNKRKGVFVIVLFSVAWLLFFDISRRSFIFLHSRYNHHYLIYKVFYGDERISGRIILIITYRLNVLWEKFLNRFINYNMVKG